MANRKRGTKQSRTKWIKKDSADFLKNPTGTPIYSRTGERLEIKPNERFVRVYEDGESSKDKFVSNYGHIVQYSQKTRAERIWNPGYLEDTKSPEKSYLKFGYNVYIHRAEWFSFAYDAIKRGKIDEIPKIWKKDIFDCKDLGNPEQILTYLFRSKYTQGNRTKASFEVHHRKNDPQDNRLSNLQLVINHPDNPVHDETTKTKKGFDKEVGEDYGKGFAADATDFGATVMTDENKPLSEPKVYDTYVTYSNYKIMAMNVKADTYLFRGRLTQDDLTALLKDIIKDYKALPEGADTVIEDGAYYKVKPLDA